ncbi:MAG: AAA family ATPase, partial [Burkholderiales bacterium]
MRTAKARSKARATANPARNRANSAAKTPFSTTTAPANAAAPNVGANTAPAPARTHTILRALGLIGLESIEPVILAAIATETPLLLIGAHGTAKSLMLSRLCEALELSWRHYNASLVNYDDLIGYPLPDAQGQLKFIQTPASVWGAAAVFIDELSRARPDMLNRLFPIIHE